jgi:hypothetical protein
MEFNFNETELTSDGLEANFNFSGWGSDNMKNAGNLKSRVLGEKAENENVYFSLSIAIRRGITDDN